MKNGEIADAIFYLKKAAQCENVDSSYSLELAKALSMISQYEQSNLIYIKLLAKGSKVGNCCYGLSQNLYYLNELEHSLYYLNLYMDKHADYFITEEEDEYIEIFEEEMYDGYSIVYPVEKQDMTELINQARALMKKGMFEKAKTLLEKVPRKNEDYIYARNNIALCCFFLNDYHSTKKYSEEVLELDKDNIFALCNLAAMYNYTEDAVSCAKYLNRILMIKTNDVSDLFKIATTLCELKEHSLALKYLKAILRIKPYDLNIMFLTAIAYYNNKDIKMSTDMFLSIIRLDEKNYAAKYYLKLIKKTQEEKDDENGYFQPLEYICQVPYGAMLTRIKYLKNCTVTKVNEIIKGDSRQNFIELCDWSFSVADLKLQKTVIERLTRVKDKDIELFLREKLIDPSVSNSIKRLIIENFILRGIPPKYDVCIDYIVKSLNPKIVTNKRKVFYQAYALCCSKLMMFMSGNIEKEIYAAYKEISGLVKNCEQFKDKKALAAIIAHRSKGKSGKMKKNMCRFFGADMATVEQYEQLLYDGESQC